MNIFSNAVDKLETAGSQISRITNGFGQFTLAALMLLITADVGLRYFFNRPIKGSYELVEFMLVMVVFLGLAYTQTRKGHISVSLLTANMPFSRQVVIKSLTSLLCLGIFLLVTWRSFMQAGVWQSSNTVSGVLEIPSFPFMWVTVFGSGLLCLVFFTDFARSVLDVIEQCQFPWLWLILDGIAVVGIFTMPIWLDMLPWDISRPAMGIIGVVLLILLLFSNMPIGPVMAVIGFVGFTNLVNIKASLAILGTSPYSSASGHAMSTIPLFILMGSLCFQAELSKDIYTTLRTWMGKLPGGLAMSTVGGCAGFAAVSGSSLATAVTMGTIAVPEMRRYKYDDSLACGCVAAGGSIGILIPPSIAFIIFASLTELSIGKLFIAGIIPGLMEAVFYILMIYVLCKIKPTLGPSGPSSTFKEKLISLKNTWGILILFTLVIGGIYAGIFTPTEAAGVGAFGALLLGLIKGTLTREKILLSFADAAKNTAMLLFMLVGADIFGYFLTMSQIPFMLAEFVVSLSVHRAVTIWAILLVYVFLGMIMPIIPAIILTIPIFYPVVLDLGYNPIWFGVIVVTMAEIGQITPPVGLNVFALAGVAKDVPLGTIYKGIFPFVVMDIVRVIILFFFPVLVLYLPSLM
jgi:tripartite ATP-independent transporter DctM subunit